MLQKKDKVLIAGIIITAVISFAIMGIAKRGEGGLLRVTVDGELYGEYSLSENQTVTVDGALGYNRIIIEDGVAYMAEADCPDKYCMDYKPISRRNETIICLPHKLVVEVAGTADSDEIDAIAQ